MTKQREVTFTMPVSVAYAMYELMYRGYDWLSDMVYQTDDPAEIRFYDNLSTDSLAIVRAFKAQIVEQTKGDV